MLKAFQKYITKHQLLSKEDVILIGVSGGRDSIVLCHLFKQAGLSFAIAHCNFNLRGNESNEDEMFVISLAKHYGVRLHKKSCNTKAYANENGVSIQMAARDLRFVWFKELIKEFNYKYYATAHHQDDAIETYLINQIRGTGIAGLHGILPKIDRLIHPLLFANRNNIDHYIKNHDLAFREDGSNSSTKYLRNKIRHELIPLLKEINPQIKSVFIENMERISSIEKILQLKIEECKKEFCSYSDKNILIQVSSFNDLDFAPTLLFELIKEYGFNYSQAIQILKTDVDETNSGALFYSSSHRMLRDRVSIIIEKSKQKIEDIYSVSIETISINEPLQIIFEQSADLNIIQDAHIAQFDLNKLKFPLILRKWETGDYFYPLGMKGKKKLLSDYFIDQKLSVFEKEDVWLLCSHNQIIWVIGYRMDDRYKITSHTKLIYKAILTNPR